MVPELDREGTIFMAVGRRGYVGFVRLENGALNVAAAFEKSLLRDSGSPAAAASQLLHEAGFGAVPELHVHAFSALEIWQGASTLGMPLRPYLERLRDEGVPMIYVSHQAADIRRIAASVVRIEAGQVKASGGLELLDGADADAIR